VYKQFAAAFLASTLIFGGCKSKDDTDVVATPDTDVVTPDFSLPEPGVLTATTTSNSISGHFQTGDFVLEFDGETNGSLTSTSFTSSDGITVISSLTESETGTWTAQIVVNNQAVDGYGALTGPEGSELERLASSTTGVAIAMAGAELGCAIENDASTQAARASILFPWQLFIKYVEGYPTAPDIDGVTACEYFPVEPLDTDFEWDYTPPEAVNMSAEDKVPHVFGIWPMDDLGAVTNIRISADGGTCDARCRGTCGAGCDSRSCTTEYEWTCVADGTKQAQRVKTCGTHEGCRVHDSCYDSCNDYWGCGTWAAASCRRACDNQCTAVNSELDCASWMQGGEPYDEVISYIDNIGAEVNDPIACPYCGDGVCDDLLAEDCDSCAVDCASTPLCETDPPTDTSPLHTGDSDVDTDADTDSDTDTDSDSDADTDADTDTDTDTPDTATSPIETAVPVDSANGDSASSATDSADSADSGDSAK
jgi:hypothetical protein